MAIRFDFYATNSIGIMRKKRKKIYKNRTTSSHNDNQVVASTFY